MSPWRIRLTLLVVLSLGAADAAAQVYGWVDEDGNAHYVGTLEEVPERFRPPRPSDEAREPATPDPGLGPPERPRAHVSEECVLRITGRSPWRGSVRSYPSCEACRKALEAMPRDEAARAACVLMPD